MGSRQILLESICTRVCSGGTPKSQRREYYECGNIPWLNTKEVAFNRIRRTESCITEEGLKNSSAKWVKKDAIIVAMYGATAGKAAIAAVPLTTNQACCNFEIDSKVADYRYVYYWLKGNYEYIASLANGGAQQNLNVGILKGLQLHLPELCEQKRIASILWQLDNKIELNNRINDYLAELMQALFKSWFLDFEPFGGSLPSEWQHGVLRDLALEMLPGDWGKDKPVGNNIKEVRCVRGADIPEINSGNEGKMPTRFILPKNYVSKRLSAGDIVVEISGGSPTQSTGRCALIAQPFLSRYNHSIICTNFCRAVKPLKTYSVFMYLYWKHFYNQGVMFSYENGTTGIKNFDIMSFLENEPIIIPPENIMAQFNHIAQKLIDMIFSNGLECEKLATTRDTLLPKLMSGEIDVSQIDITQLNNHLCDC